MKNLWTPWRMAHVDGSAHASQADVCIFEPPGEAACDKAHLLLYRDHLLVALLNRFPYANGHLLLAPRRHVADITELNPAEQAGLMALLSYSCTVLRRHFKAEGINIGLNLGECAGAGIPGHLHFHVVPRWSGDHNFMTVLADIRTIPQHIEASFDLLLPDFQQFSAP